MVEETIARILMKESVEGIFGGRGWREYKSHMVWVFPHVLVEPMDIRPVGERRKKKGRGRPRQSYWLTPEDGIINIVPTAFIWVGSPYEPYPRPTRPDDYCHCGGGMYIVHLEAAICVFCGRNRPRAGITNGSEHDQLPML